jgi:hypothetical protein
MARESVMARGQRKLLFRTSYLENISSRSTLASERTRAVTVLPR